MSYWLWYPGDFERYHALKQNFSRVERGVGWPAFWKSEGFRNRVTFRRHYRLTEDTCFQDMYWWTRINIPSAKQSTAHPVPMTSPSTSAA